MQSSHVSARALQVSQPTISARVASKAAINGKSSSGIQPLLQRSQSSAHPSSHRSVFRPGSPQVASSDWVCASCTSRFLAGDQKVWQPHIVSNGKPVRTRRGGPVTAQWFHFKSRKSLNVPLREQTPGVDEYLQDTERIVHIAFPDRRRLKYLGDGLWRATLRPVAFFSISATPVTDVRTWYEDGALQISSNRVVLDLAGLPEQFHNIDLRLNLRGALTRRKSPGQGPTDCAMDGSVDLGVGVDLPMPLSLIPGPAVNAVGNAILEGILIAMDSALRRGLVDDYRKWCLEKKGRVGEPQVQAR